MVLRYDTGGNMIKLFGWFLVLILMMFCTCDSVRILIYTTLLYDPYHIYPGVVLLDFKFTPKGCRLKSLLSHR